MYDLPMKSRVTKDEKPKLSERIQEIAVDLTPQERVLSEALVLRPDVAAYESLRRFADQQQVDPSVLSRLVGKLGYEKYRDLQDELRWDLTRRLPSPVERERAGRHSRKPDLPELLQLSLEDDILQLQNMHAVVTAPAMAKAIELLATAPGSVFVIGNGWSRSLADMMAHRLALARPRVESSTTIDLLGNGKLVGCGPTDCAVAISSRRYAARTLQITQALHRRKVQIIAITDLPDSPLLRSAHHALLIPNLRAGFYDSPTPIAATIHLLCTGVSFRLSGKSSKSLDELESLARDLRLFSEQG